MTILTLTFDLSINSQNIWRGVVLLVLINISPSNIYKEILLSKRYSPDSQTILGATGWRGGGMMIDESLTINSLLLALMLLVANLANTK